MNSKIIFLVCFVCLTKAKTLRNFVERSNCPDVSHHCYDTDWCEDTAQTYFFLEDGTKCQGCAECIPAPPKVECPTVFCPYWDIPLGCQEVGFLSLYLDYEGRECRACEALFCFE